MRKILPQTISTDIPISLVIGGITWVASKNIASDLAPMLALASFFFTLFIIMASNLRKAWENTSREMSDIQQKVKDALGVWETASSDPFLMLALKQILSDYEKIKKENDVFFLKEIHDKIDIAKETIRTLSVREIKDRPMVETNAHLYIEFLYRVADDKILSLSCGEEVEWWEEPEGKQYWKYNIEALKRGIEIERIFIIDEDKDFRDNSKLLSLMQEQVNHKPPIKVRTARINPCKKLARNSIVFDNKKIPRYTVWVNPSSEKKLDKWNLSGIERVAKEFLNSYDLIRGVSDEFVPPINKVGDKSSEI